MEIEEFKQKYGDVVLSFNHYHKFMFIFSATMTDGTAIHGSLGCTADEIYGLHISSDDVYTVNQLCSDGAVILARDGNGVVFFEWTGL